MAGVTNRQLASHMQLFAWLHAALALILESVFILYMFTSVKFNRMYSCDRKVWGDAHASPLV